MLNGQIDTFFVDTLGVVQSRELAQRYRILVDTDSGILVNEYNRENQLLNKCHYTTRSCHIRHGYFVDFYPDGNKQSEGYYRLGIKTGCWQWYANDGNSVKEQRTYFTPSKGYYLTEWIPEKSVIQREGFMDAHGRKTGEWKEYYSDTPLIKRLMHYDAGSRTGMQLEYYRNGQVKRIETIQSMGKMKGKMFDEQGRKIHYYPAFENAVPPEPLKKYLSVRVPCFDAALKQNNIRYTLTITNTGEIKYIAFPDLPDDDCKKELLQALSRMKRWKPAKVENKPINFHLNAVIKYHVPRE